MNIREFNKIDTYKVNWYALTACICAKKEMSVAQGCKSLGIELKESKGGSGNRYKNRYKKANFDKTQVEKLYKELKTVGKVALSLDVCESSLRKFMLINGIIVVRTKITDSYDMKEIKRLISTGKNLVEVSKITGYKYFNLYKFMQENKTEKVAI